MRRLVLVLAVSLVAASGLAAAASTLVVTSDPVQVFRVDVDPPPVEEVDLQVEVRTYAGNGGNLKDTLLLGPYPVRPDLGYHVAYDGHVRTCPEGSTSGPSQLGGPFEVPAGGVHVLCVQHGEYADNTVTLRSGDAERHVVLPRGGIPGAATGSGIS